MAIHMLFETIPAIFLRFKGCVGSFCLVSLSADCKSRQKNAGCWIVNKIITVLLSKYVYSQSCYLRQLQTSLQLKEDMFVLVCEVILCLVSPSADCKSRQKNAGSVVL